MTRVGIVQPNYVPWKGYFDMIAAVDEFLLFDDVQYTTRDWRNRNRIRTRDGSRWLTIPVETRGRREQRIDEVTIADSEWARRHWSVIEQSYSALPGYSRWCDELQAAFARAAELPLLVDVDEYLVRVVCSALGIDTQLRRTSSLTVTGAKTDRLLSVCQAVGADVYVTGPRALAYLDVAAFDGAHIEVEVVDYEGYEVYEQLAPPFEHAVSILDLMLSVADDPRRWLKCWTGDGWDHRRMTRPLSSAEAGGLA